MTPSLNDHPPDVVHELEKLRTEMAEIRHQQTRCAVRGKWRLSIGLLAAPLIIVSSWAWSAPSLESVPSDIKERLSALERMVRRGSNNTTQLSAPFEVIGPDGKAMMQVNSAGVSLINTSFFVLDSQGRARAVMAAGAVSVFDEKGDHVVDIHSPSVGSGEVAVYSKDKKVVTIATDKDGSPYIDLSDLKDIPRTIMAAGAVSVFDEKGNGVVDIHSPSVGRGEVAVSNKDRKVAVMTSEDFGQVAVLNKGKKVVSLNANFMDGTGFVDVSDAKGVPRAIMAPGVVSVFDQKGGHVASIEAVAEDRGKVTVFNKSHPVSTMEVDGQAGKLTVMNSAGKPVIGLTGGQTGGGRIAVADSASMPLAEMYVSDEGKGFFQVNKNQRPIAVLTEKVERPGGLVQLYNVSGQGVASLTVGGDGGYFQLTNNSGVATVEAGTQADGTGTVRVGPKYSCSQIAGASSLFGKGVSGLPDCLVGSTKEGRTFKDRVADQFPFGEPPFHKK